MLATVQMPEMQLRPVAHEIPQPPQLVLSVCRLRHAPVQKVWPVGHGAHTPLVQTWPVGQAVGEYPCPSGLHARHVVESAQERAPGVQVQGVQTPAPRHALLAAQAADV